MTKEKVKSLLDPSEQEIRLSFTNYKLLKRDEFNLTGSHIYFVKGCNEVGKTSILTALRAAMEMKDDTPQKVTLGETDGVCEFTIPGPDGKMYNVVYEFTDTTTKFVIFDEEGNKISKITDMRNIFKYNHVDATSFISWSRTAEGRRKQKEYILELLPAESYLQYKDLETKEGELFNQRTKANKDLDDAKLLLKNEELTSEEKEIQKNLKVAEEQLKKREVEFESLTKVDNKIQEVVNQMIQVEAKISRVNNDSLVYIQNIENLNKVSNSNIVEYENRIKELQTKIEVEKTSIQSNFNSIQLREKTVTDLIEPDTKILSQLKINKEALELEKGKGVDPEKLNKLSVSVETGRAYVNRAKTLTEKLVKFDGFKAKSDTLTEKVDNLTKEITELRTGKEKVILEGKFPVDNLSFDEEGYLTISGLRFDEHQTCESDTILIVAQLLCKMNITPIQILGDASLLDYNKLDKLYEIAEANGKIMFVDEIDRTLDKLVIVGYEKKNKDKEEKKSTKPLF